MLENKYISKEKINIKMILNEKSNKEFFTSIFKYISTYLNISVDYVENFTKDKNDEIINNNNKKIDFFFVDFIKDYEYIFAWNFYSQMHELNKEFKLVLFKEKIEEEDIKYFKNGADDIIYCNKKYYSDVNEYLRWKIFSLIRRKWDNARNKHVLIHNGVIIDLIKRNVIINNQEINITKKEFQVLQILVDDFNGKKSFNSKNKLFKKIYGVENDLNSRVIDQIIFRLKNKFPNNFFEFDKRKGIKIL